MSHLHPVVLGLQVLADGIHVLVDVVGVVADGTVEQSVLRLKDPVIMDVGFFFGIMSVFQVGHKLRSSLRFRVVLTQLTGVDAPEIKRVC